MWNWLGKVSMEIGDLFRYKKKKGFIDWNEIEGHIGVILSGPNRHGQYKTLIKNKTLYILRTTHGEVMKIGDLVTTLNQSIYIGVVIEKVFHGEWYVHWLNDDDMTCEYESHLRVLA